MGGRGSGVSLYTNLNAAISHGPQEAFALRGDVRPFPLEKVRDGMPPRGTGRVAPRPALH